jgi:hypothetical protein
MFARFTYWLIKRVIAPASVAGAIAVLVMAIVTGFFFSRDISYQGAVRFMYLEIAFAILCGAVSGYWYRHELR